MIQQTERRGKTDLRNRSDHAQPRRQPRISRAALRRLNAFVSAQERRIVGPEVRRR